jgi:hypothetical protein
MQPAKHACRVWCVAGHSDRARPPAHPPPLSEHHKMMMRPPACLFEVVVVAAVALAWAPTAVDGQWAQHNGYCGAAFTSTTATQVNSAYPYDNYQPGDTGDTACKRACLGDALCMGYSGSASQTGGNFDCTLCTTALVGATASASPTGLSIYADYKTHAKPWDEFNGYCGAAYTSTNATQVNSAYTYAGYTPGDTGNSWCRNACIEDALCLGYSGSDTQTGGNYDCTLCTTAPSATGLSIYADYKTYVKPGAISCGAGQYINTTTETCASPTCSDSTQNGDETGVDCGGSCSACPTCSDSTQNGDETGVDCGGSCSACPTCSDSTQNGDETGVDCGGSCSTCPTCSDSTQNGDETGVDCGGSCAACASSPSAPSSSGAVSSSLAAIVGLVAVLNTVSDFYRSEAFGSCCCT